MPFESFNLRAEDLNMAPLAPSKSVPGAGPHADSSDNATTFRSITSKASIRNLSKKASTISLSRKASKPALRKKSTVEQLHSREGLSRVTTNTTPRAAATTEVTLKSRLAGIWESMSSYFVKAAVCRFFLFFWLCFLSEYLGICILLMIG